MFSHSLLPCAFKSQQAYPKLYLPLGFFKLLLGACLGIDGFEDIAQVVVVGWGGRESVLKGGGGGLAVEALDGERPLAQRRDVVLEFLGVDRGGCTGFRLLLDKLFH